MKGHADRCSLLERQVGGFGAHGGTRKQNLGGVGTVALEAEVPAAAPDLLTNEVGVALQNNAREVAPRRSGQGRMRHQSLHVLNVAGVDRRCFDADKHLIQPRPQIRQIFQPEFCGRSKLMKTECAHSGVLSRHVRNDVGRASPDGASAWRR